MNTPRAIGLFGVLLGASLAHAGSIGTAPACEEGTFASYLSPVGAQFRCNLGAVDVYNFELYTVSDGVATFANSDLLSTIRINPIWNSETQTASLSIQGFTNLTMASDETATYRIRYTIDPPPILGGESMELDPPHGDILGSQLYCKNAEFVTNERSVFCPNEGGGTVPFGFSDASGTPVNIPANLLFNPPLFTLDTLTDITLNPTGTRASGFDGVVFAVQIAPEPSAWLLAASGLVLVLGRRFRRH